MIIERVNPKAPKVSGVKVSNDEPLDVKKPLPGWSYASLVVGGPGSGKTSLIISLIKRYYKKKYDRVYLFSGSLQTLPESFTGKLNEERIFSNLDSLDEVVEDVKNSNDKTLIIIDDLAKEVGDKHKEVMRLIFNRRHIGGGIALYIITQKLNVIPLSIRSAFDTIYFFSFNNKKEVNSLFDDYIVDLDRKEYDEMIKYIMDSKQKAPFLYINKRDSKYFLKFNELEIKKPEISSDEDK